MKRNWIRALILAAIALTVFASASFCVVTETEQVVITQLGKPVGAPVVEAGLHFKIPLVQKANYFEKRIMKWDGSPNQIPTRDKKYIWVDSTARWRIKDPLLFLKRVGSLSTAQSRLDGIIDSVVRDHISNNELVELVRSEGWEEAKQTLWEAGIPDFELLQGEGDLSMDSEGNDRLTKGREKITREMVADAAHFLPEFGIELLHIRVKRINYDRPREEEAPFPQATVERCRAARMGWRGRAAFSLRKGPARGSRAHGPALVHGG